MEYRLFRKLSGAVPSKRLSPITDEERQHVRMFDNGEIRVRTIQGNTMILSFYKPEPAAAP